MHDASLWSVLVGCTQEARGTTAGLSARAPRISAEVPGLPEAYNASTFSQGAIMIPTPHVSSIPGEITKEAVESPKRCCRCVRNIATLLSMLEDAALYSERQWGQWPVS